MKGSLIIKDWGRLKVSIQHPEMLLLLGMGKFNMPLQRVADCT